MVADGPGPNSAIKEPIVTMREGRYVIPVRADRRSQISGVVHATSASGQTLFMEPMDVVEMNNRWRELQMAEQHEIERILRALSDQVGSYANELIQNVEAVAAIDLSLAKARLSFDLGREGAEYLRWPRRKRKSACSSGQFASGARIRCWIRFGRAD